MTVKRKLFYGITGLILGFDVSIHFFRELKSILAVANEPPGWPHSFSWLANAFVVLMWNTFAGTAETIESPLGIIAIAVVVWGFFITKPISQPKI